ncbi:ABC transporter substrate-binding protein [Streptomyces sp. NPDC087263]|uniref:ABC transporter substrate-binding protein n=1 Tax=Streptomyces sp. NPDC087263 TaxID=3365773 RepID=UPI0037FCB462
MSSFISRRRVLATGTALGLGALGATTAPAAAASPAASRSATGAEETRTLDELYEAALAEDGKLVIYAGGDFQAQQEATRQAFRSRFPGIELTLIVDYSKFHDARVDNQFATDTLVPDVVQLQTLQDFTRWDEEGRLLRYKPAGFSKVYDGFKEQNGSCVAVQANAFSFVYNIAAAGSDAPTTPLDLIDPKWKGKIASRYPHDDDATLYLFTKYVEKYGWDWVAAYAAQDNQYLRGGLAVDAVVAGQRTIAVGVGGSPLQSATSPTKLIVPDGHPFIAWGQRAAILKQAKNPTAAKLYLNWQLSTARQQTTSNGWSVRTDVTPPAGMKPLWEYPDVYLDFPQFMADRAEVERLKQTFALYFGEVTGDATPGWLGLHPGA